MKLNSVNKELEILIDWNDLSKYNIVLKRVVKGMFDTDDKKVLNKLQLEFDEISNDARGW